MEALKASNLANSWHFARPDIHLKGDLFRQELVNLINLRHPLVQLAQKIDWKSCEARFDGPYATGIGRPGHPIRLMMGLQLLSHTRNLSDEEVVESCAPTWAG
jgi:IS5 family transposase